ncbi:hypothetical protein [Quadrisphaera sp. DSM 44207]|uniref:hypothetical protein n=1 Tax=Quadrisphaera sp. DSM 44207 TaxID=1881057 RepID=UPI00088B505C|nr:hypothetical protein [Quadrisphaera sp. DSM 44207]SDQ48354.1 Uncharacterized conserved protein [Quadrisphaera sp. DSM 44207]
MSPTAVATLVVLAVLAVLAWALTAYAARLDRLHHRVETSRAALDAQLLRRAGAAEQLAVSRALDPATSLLLASAAAEAVAADGDAEREAAESDLSRALRAALSPPAVRALRADPGGRGLLADLSAACSRAVLARRFHNDAVTQTRAVRSSRVVRWARLAGRAPLPRTFEIDDEPPALDAADQDGPGRDGPGNERGSGT